MYLFYYRAITLKTDEYFNASLGITSARTGAAKYSKEMQVISTIMKLIMNDAGDYRDS